MLELTIFTLAANAMPLERHLIELKKLIAEYEKNPSEELENHIALICAMVFEKVSNRGKNVFEAIKENEDKMKWMEMHPSNNRT